MRPHRSLLIVSFLAVALTAFAGCRSSHKDGSSALRQSDVPTATAPATLPTPILVSGGSTPAGTGNTYTVQSGDNPSTIAEQFGITAEELMAANGITDPTSLYTGQVLTIPHAPSGSNVLGATVAPTPKPTTPAAPQPTTAAPTPAPGGQVYTVREGDIPETIAAQFGITAEELMAANGISDPTSLQIGQQLVIPTPQPTPSQ